MGIRQKVGQTNLAPLASCVKYDKIARLQIPFRTTVAKAFLGLRRIEHFLLLCSVLYEERAVFRLLLREPTASVELRTIYCTHDELEIERIRNFDPSRCAVLPQVALVETCS